MQNISPFNQSDLLREIELIKSKKRTEQEELVNCFNQFVYTLHPVSILKNSINSLVTDPDVTFDLANAGAQMGTNIVIDLVLGRYRSVKGFIGSILLEKVIQPYLRQFVSNQLNKSRKIAL